jgi:hypothetical protein
LHADCTEPCEQQRPRRGLGGQDAFEAPFQRGRERPAIGGVGEDVILAYTSGPMNALILEGVHRALEHYEQEAA